MTPALLLLIEERHGFSILINYVLTAIIIFFKKKANRNVLNQQLRSA